MTESEKTAVVMDDTKEVNEKNQLKAADTVAKDTEKEGIKETANGGEKTPIAETDDDATAAGNGAEAKLDKRDTDETGKEKPAEKREDPEIEEAVTKPSEKSAKSAAEAIQQDLGDTAKQHYEVALPLVTESPNLEKLEKATEQLVEALQNAPEEKATTRGYGELALLYGRALLGFVVRGAAEGDVLGGKAKAGDEEDTEEKEEKEEEKEETEEEKEETTEELCWTQLEVARLAFEKSGPKDKLCESVRTIGEFLLACDQASAAGEEFGSAASMCDGREKVECLYKRYLSLRRVSVEDARESLKEAISVMSEISGTDDVVKEMKEELAALPGEEGKGVKRSAEVTVTRVTPKRRK